MVYHQGALALEPIHTLAGYNVNCSEQGLEKVPGQEYKKFKTGLRFADAKLLPYVFSRGLNSPLFITVSCPRCFFAFYIG